MLRVTLNCSRVELKRDRKVECDCGNEYTISSGALGTLLGMYYVKHIIVKFDGRKQTVVVGVDDVIYHGDVFSVKQEEE